MLTTVFSVVLVLVPGAYALWKSRKLVRRLDDPLFPDLMLAHSQRVSVVAGTAIGIGIVFAHETIGLVMVAMTLAVSMAGFPARRTIYDETWSLGSYMLHGLRVWFALFGFYFILALAPAVMAWSEAWAFEIGVGFAVLAMFWTVFSSALVPMALRARRFDRPHLEARFKDVLLKARCETPAIYEAGAPGGTFVNAFALPSWHRPGALFTTDLLESLDDDETTAIFGHEVAHLEHHGRRQVLIGLVAALVLVMIPVVLWSGSLAATFRGWEWVWPLVLLFGLIAKLQRHRAHETESDVRAVELTGNPEALVTALTKIHTHLRLSRRWSERFEQRSTHPSLARRIRAIRQASGPRHRVEPFEPLIVVAPGTERRVLVLDSEKLHLLTGIPEGNDLDAETLLSRSQERRSLTYAEIRDLRLQESGEQRDLVFTTQDGLSERVPVANELVPEVSAVLGRIDALIGYARATKTVSNGRLVSLILAALALLPPYSFVLCAFGILTLALPATVTHAALGMAGLATALMYVTRPDPWALGVGPLHIALLVGVSFVPVWLALQRHRRGMDGSPRLTVGVVLTSLLLLALSCLGLLAVHGSELPGMQLHLWARQHGSAFVASIALAAAMFATRGWAAKAAAVVALTLACLFFSMGSLGFREGFTDDVFRARVDALPVDEVALTRKRSFEVDGAVSKIVLAPGGESVALLISDHDYYEPLRGRYLVETSEGELVEVEALGLEFVSEQEIAILARDGDETVVRVGRPESIFAARRLSLPPLENPVLDVEAGDPTWRVLGDHPDSDDTMSIVASSQFSYSYAKHTQETFLRYEPETATTFAMGPRTHSLRLEHAYPERDGSFVPPALFYSLWSASSTEVAIELIIRKTGAQDLRMGRTALSLRCPHTPETYGAFVCVTTENGSTTFWELEPGNARFEPIASFPGYFYDDDVSASGQVIVQQWMGTPYLVDLKNRTAATPLLPDKGVERRSYVERFLYGHELESTDWGTLAWRDDVLVRAQISYETDMSTITIYTVTSSDQ